MKSFFILYGIFLFAGASLMVNYSKAELFLLINRYHNSLGDNVLYCWTHLGSGIASLIAVIILSFIKYRYALICAISFITTGITVQVLKRTIFEDVIRPLNYFEQMQTNIYVIPGLDIHLENSFPSGHTATAFSLFCLITMLVAKKNRANNLLFGILFFVLALGVGYSRVYLSQHFFTDIYFGSVVGTLFTLVVYRYFHSAKFDDSSWLERSLGANKNA